MAQFLPQNDYLRSETWVHGGTAWAINKVVLSRNSTMFPVHLLSEFKEYARVDSGTEDVLCKFMLASALESIEEFTGLTITPTERQWAMRDWPSGKTLQIPGQPVQTIMVLDDDTGLDITADCEYCSNVQDVHFYVRFPTTVANPRVIFGSGFYRDPTDFNIWTVPSVWHLINVWSVPNSVLDEHPLIKHAVLATAAEMYQNRELTTERTRTNIPSIVEHVLRPLRRPPGY
jgi:hypothetical protein